MIREKTYKPKFQSLAKLAQEANEHHDEAEQHLKTGAASMRAALHAAKLAGDALNKAKGWLKMQKRKGKTVPTWMDWVRTNFKGSHRTATDYMLIARTWDKHDMPHLLNRPVVSIAGAVKAIRQERGLTRTRGKPARGAWQKRELRKLFDDWLDRSWNAEIDYLADGGCLKFWRWLCRLRVALRPLAPPVIKTQAREATALPQRERVSAARWVREHAA